MKGLTETEPSESDAIVHGIMSVLPKKNNTAK
jgi:hypothetical protein